MTVQAKRAPGAGEQGQLDAFETAGDSPPSRPYRIRFTDRNHLRSLIRQYGPAVRAVPGGKVYVDETDGALAIILPVGTGLAAVADMAAWGWWRPSGYGTRKAPQTGVGSPPTAHEDEDKDEDASAGRPLTLDDYMTGEDTDPAEAEEDEDIRAAALRLAPPDTDEDQEEEGEEEDEGDEDEDEDQEPELDLLHSQRARQMQRQHAGDTAEWEALRAARAREEEERDRPFEMTAQQRQQASRDVHNPHAWAENPEQHEQRAREEFRRQWRLWRAWDAKTPKAQATVFAQSAAAGWKQLERREANAAVNARFAAQLSRLTLRLVARKREWAEREALRTCLLHEEYHDLWRVNAPTRDELAAKTLVPVTAGERTALCRVLRGGEGLAWQKGHLRMVRLNTAWDALPDPAWEARERWPWPAAVRPRELDWAWMSVRHLAKQWGVTTEAVRKRLKVAEAPWVTDGNARYYPRRARTAWDDTHLWERLTRPVRMGVKASRSWDAWRNQHDHGYGAWGRKWTAEGGAEACARRFRRFRWFAGHEMQWRQPSDWKGLTESVPRPHEAA